MSPAESSDRSHTHDKIPPEPSDRLSATTQRGTQPVTDYTQEEDTCVSMTEDITHPLALRRTARERTRRSMAEITDDRRIEWLTASVFLGFGICLSFPGNTFEVARVWMELHHLLGGNGELIVGWIMIAVAFIKGAALTVNGVRGKPTSLVRFATSVIGAGLFAVLSYTIALPWLLGEIDAPSTGMFTYAALAGADYVSAVKAARDARIYRDDQ